jgi:hypothetical protein
MDNKTLEQKAKQLLKWRLTEKGDVPNPFTPDFPEQINYLLDKQYIIKSGQTPKSLSYAVTKEGKKWALGK